MHELYFCTLFDSNYFAKGLLTIYSLLNVCPEAKVYVLAMDNLTCDLLNREGLSQVHVVPLSEFESPDLLAAKSNRSAAEYCWTCGSAFVYYCITTYDLPSCIYIDADLYFYSSPQILLEEIGTADVMLTEHRYTPQYNRSVLSGKYCVQFMYFKNTTNGLHILKWWRDSCLEWCYARYEDGRFGDQKYLDDWTNRFEGVHVMRYEGGGLAPWNIQQYEMVGSPSGLMVRNKHTNCRYNVVFYHFHHLRNYKLNDYNEFRMGPYPISKQTKELIYLPYVKELVEVCRHYCDPEYDTLGSIQVELSNCRLLFHKMKALVYPKDKIKWHI